jgi:hypothetical protein
MLLGRPNQHQRGPYSARPVSAPTRARLTGEAR